ncbi:MAG: phage portal protein [Eubacteriales bacterium]
MLNDLKWLKTGEQWPPAEERERLQRYAENKKIFDNRHIETYSEQWKRIEKVVGSAAEVIAYPIILNYQKKISMKVADFLFVEPPMFSENAREIAKLSELYSIGYQAAIDCSRYGTAVLKIDVENGLGKVSISSPEFLFTVVDRDDRKKIVCYVMAYIDEVEDEKGRKKSHLTAYVHGKGSYTKKVFEMRGDRIGKVLLEERDVKTQLSDFAIVPVHNVLTSDSVYGVDDYADVDSIISEIEIRTAQISKILDTHANPTVSGSRSALTYNKRTGEYTFDSGNFYARDTSSEPPLEYVTWEANLDANFRQIKQLMNYLSTISEMGAAVLDGDMKTGSALSGTALKRLYINVLAKVARVRNAFDGAFKKAISLASEIGHEKIGLGDVGIMWQDGLPNDAVELAEIISKRTGGAATMSVERALRMYGGMSTAEVEMEEKKIKY